MMAGQYNEIVKIYETVEAENEYGERTTELKLVCSTRAKHEATGGSRTEENNEIVYNYNKTFYVRSYVQITDTSIIEYDGKRYRVLTYDKRKGHNDIKILTELINV